MDLESDYDEENEWNFDMDSNLKETNEEEMDMKSDAKETNSKHLLRNTMDCTLIWNRMEEAKELDVEPKSDSIERDELDAESIS